MEGNEKQQTVLTLLEYRTDEERDYAGLGDLLGNEKFNEYLKERFEDRVFRQDLLSREMSMKCLESYDRHMFEKSYFIPKPSSKSKPLVLIFYNMFSSTDQPLKNSKRDATKPKKAWTSLGWGDSVYKKDDWRYPTLLTMLKEKLNSEGDICSLFILCIISHGAAGIIHGERNTSGPIQKIMDTVNDHPALKKFVPKVIKNKRNLLLLRL